MLSVYVTKQMGYEVESGDVFKYIFSSIVYIIIKIKDSVCRRMCYQHISIIWNCSANLTGAGIGMKSRNRRNFEAGILTDDPTLVESALEQFDSVWRGAHCDTCGRRQYCIDPIK